MQCTTASHIQTYIWCDRLLDSSKTETLPWLAAQRTDLHVSGGITFNNDGMNLCAWSIFVSHIFFLILFFPSSVLKCEYCGSLAPASQFRGSKRFCSNTCAKRYDLFHLPVSAFSLLFDVVHASKLYGALHQGWVTTRAQTSAKILFYFCSWCLRWKKFFHVSTFYQSSWKSGQTNKTTQETKPS